MINYIELVKLNNSLKANPFLSHLTITKVSKGYVYFDNGANCCTLEQLIQAMMNNQGYVTNISMLKTAVDSYNSKLEKDEKHSQLQQRLQNNVSEVKHKQEIMKEERLQAERNANGIKDSDVSVELNTVAKKLAKVLGVDIANINTNLLEQIHAKYMKKDNNGNWIYENSVDGKKIIYVNSKGDINYYRYFMLLQYLRYYIGAYFFKEYNCKVFDYLNTHRISYDTTRVVDVTNNGKATLEEILQALVRGDDEPDTNWMWSCGIYTYDAEGDQLLSIFVSFNDYNSTKKEDALEYLRNNIRIKLEYVNDSERPMKILKDLGFNSVDKEVILSARGVDGIIKLYKDLTKVAADDTGINVLDFLHIKNSH